MPNLPEIVATATEMVAHINEKFDELDKMLTPICVELMKSNDIDSVEYLTKHLPLCFWRTELKTWLYSKNDCNARS